MQPTHSKDEVLAAVRRSDRALVEQLSEWEALEFGVAHCSTQYPSLAAANQLRDVWLAELDGPTAFERAEAYYQSRGLTCLAWTPASGQAVEPVEAVLRDRGWQTISRVGMALEKGDAVAVEPDSPVRVLPARAMRRALHQTFDDAAGDADVVAEAAADRLNDPNHDTFVAMCDGVAAGRISFLQVGDISRVDDLFIVPAFRGRDVDRALVAHILQLARRLLPKIIVASPAAQNADEIAFFESCGFATAGTLREFRRPT